MNESDDDDSSYVTHTQHLVDVMEERIKQVSEYNYAAMQPCSHEVLHHHLAQEHAINNCFILEDYFTKFSFGH